MQRGFRELPVVRAVLAVPAPVERWARQVLREPRARVENLAHRVIAEVLALPEIPAHQVATVNIALVQVGFILWWFRRHPWDMVAPLLPRGGTPAKSNHTGKKGWHSSCFATTELRFFLIEKLENEFFVKFWIS